MSDVSVVSQGNIEDRAAKLSDTPDEKTPPPAAPATPPVADPAAPKAPATPPAAEPEKKFPNDPEEMRKWNTRVSMELSEVKQRLEQLTEVLNKTSKKKIDWKELAKDPAKLQEAIEAEKSEWEQKYNDAHFESTREITQLENQRRMNDPAYPRWAELQPLIVNLAAQADSRVNFNQHPRKALDQMYEIASEIADKDPNFKRAPAMTPPGPKTYTEEELNAKIEAAKSEARSQAQKGLGAEEAAAGVAGMGKGAPKGKGGVDKEALWSMPLGSLKAALIKASPQ